MAKIKYVFGELKTGQVIVEIPLISVSMTKELNTDGELRATIHLDQTGYSNEDIKSATIPGRSYVVVERDNSPVWAGIVWTSTYQSQSKSLQLYCKSFEAYLDCRFIRQDLLYNNIDQGTIFLSLWNNLQSLSHSNLLVNVPSSFITSVTKTLDVKASDFKSYMDAVNALANGEDGFDWTIDVSKTGGVYVRTLRVGYPTLGSAISADSITFDYPGNILNYWSTDSISDSATNVFTIGAGEGTSMLVQEREQIDLLNSGWLK